MRREWLPMGGLGLVAAAAGFSASPPASGVPTTRTRRPPLGRTVAFPITRGQAYRNKCFLSLVATRMTSQGESPPDEETTMPDTDEASAASPTASVSTTKTRADAVDEAPKGAGISLILLPTLLFKFAVVMGIKFATDAVVYPLLWLYRLARLAKRKLVSGWNGVFGRRDLMNVKVNGAAGEE